MKLLESSQSDVQLSKTYPLRSSLRKMLISGGKWAAGAGLLGALIVPFTVSSDTSAIWIGFFVVTMLALAALGAALIRVGRRAQLILHPEWLLLDWGFGAQVIPQDQIQQIRRVGSRMVLLLGEEGQTLLRVRRAFEEDDHFRAWLTDGRTSLNRAHQEAERRRNEEILGDALLEAGEKAPEGAQPIHFFQ